MAEVFDYFAFLLAQGEDIVIEELSQPEISYERWEDVIDFEPSSLNDVDAPYHPGPDERPYDERQELDDPDDPDLPWWFWWGER